MSTSAGGTSDGADETLTTSAPAVVTSSVYLIGRMGFVSPGQVIGVEVGCFGPSACSGSFNVTVNGQTIGTGSFTESANTGAFQNIKLNSTGQSDMRANRVNHLLLTNVAITTTAGQKINGSLSLARLELARPPALTRRATDPGYGGRPTGRPPSAGALGRREAAPGEHGRQHGPGGERDERGRELDR